MSTSTGAAVDDAQVIERSRDEPEYFALLFRRHAPHRGARLHPAGDLIRQAYLPPAQRAAVYRALGLLPGLRLIEGAQDAAGRTGVAVAHEDTGAASGWSCCSTR